MSDTLPTSHLKILNMIKSKSVLDFLLIVSEKIEEIKECRGFICEAKLILQLIKNCESLELGVKHMEDGIRAEAKEMKDKEFQQEIDEMHPRLVNCLKELSNSFRNLYHGETDKQDITEVWDDIIKYLEELLDHMSQVMLNYDLARLRSVNKALDHLCANLKALKFSSHEKMLPKYEEISKQAVIVGQLVGNAAEEVSCKSQKDQLFILLSQLHKTLRILGNVLLRCRRRPLSKDTKVCLSFVLMEMESVINKLKKEINSDPGTYDIQEPGQYMHTMNSVFEILSSQKGVDTPPFVDRLKPHLEAIFQQAFFLSQNLDQSEATSLVGFCEKILRELTILSELEKNCDVKNESEIEESLNKIFSILNPFEVRFNIAFMSFVVNSLAEPFSSLGGVLKTIAERGGRKELKKEELDPLISSLEAEADKLYQVGMFVLSFVKKPSDVFELHGLLKTLEWLESGLHASITSSTRERKNRLQILILNEEWRKCVEKFVKRIYQMLDTRAVLQITKDEIHWIWADVRSNSSPLDEKSLLSKNSRAVALARRVLQLNEEEQFLKEAQQVDLIRVLKEIKNYERNVDWISCDQKTRKGLRSRLQILLTSIARISSSYSQMDKSSVKSSVTESGINSDLGVIDLKKIAAAFKSIFKENENRVRRRRLRSGEKSKQELQKVPMMKEEKESDEDSVNSFSIDISKFLESCSKSAASQRSSKFNFSRKVVEIDLEDFIKRKSLRKSFKGGINSLNIKENSILQNTNDKDNLINEMKCLENPKPEEESKSKNISVVAISHSLVENNDPAHHQGQSCIASPVSVNISTPKRLEDIDVVTRRLNVLKSIFKIDL